MEEIIKERLELARLRIGQIKEEEKAPFWSSFFEETALHLEKLFSLAEGLPAFQEAKMMWESLWKYNPKEDREQTDSVERFHKLKLLLIGEFRVLISEAYRGRTEILLLYGELFLQLFGAVQDLHAFPEKLYRELRELIYWFYFDNCEELCACFGEAVFRDKKERERVLNLNRLDSDYLYQSGARLDGSAKARSVYYGLCSLDQLEKEAKEVLALAEIPIQDTDCYLGFLPGMEPLAAACIRLFEREGGRMHVFAESRLLPLRSLHSLQEGSVRMWPEADVPSEQEETLVLNPDYRERKIEAWRAVLKKFPKPDSPAYVICLAEEDLEPKGPETYGSLSLTRAKNRLVREADKAITRMFSDYIRLEELVVIRKGA